MFVASLPFVLFSFPQNIYIFMPAYYFVHKQQSLLLPVMIQDNPPYTALPRGLRER